MAKKAQEQEQGSDLLENQEALAEQISKTEQYLEIKTYLNHMDKSSPKDEKSSETAIIPYKIQHD